MKFIITNIDRNTLFDSLDCYGSQKFRYKSGFQALKYTIYNENTLFPIKLVLDIFWKSRKREKSMFPVILYCSLSEVVLFGKIKK